MMTPEYELEMMTQALYFTAIDLRRILNTTMEPKTRRDAQRAFDRVEGALGYEPIGYVPERPAPPATATETHAGAVGGR